MEKERERERKEIKRPNRDIGLTVLIEPCTETERAFLWSPSSNLIPTVSMTLDRWEKFKWSANLRVALYAIRLKEETIGVNLVDFSLADFEILLDFRFSALRD